MADFWGLAVATGVAAGAWLYQRAWERRERRLTAYIAIVDSLSAFTVKGLDPDKIDAALRELRRLWLFGPDDVIEAADAFIATVETGASATDEARERALKKFVLAMRRDASFFAAIIPRLGRSNLQSSHFRLKSASR